MVKKFKDYLESISTLSGLRIFSRLVGPSDPWSKENGGSFSEMMGPSILN